MPRRTLNLGILAHVDAGKTTLTERLLYQAGIIDAVGSVDEGTTRTDTLELERARGITIKAAVVSFDIDDVTVNLIDTPGHPDFIAEVDRVLSLLDGAVLVLSAVEGVQPQSRVLMRALGRLQVPTMLFVNKIDRAGADADRVLAAMGRRLSAAALPMGTVVSAGTRAAQFLPYQAEDPAFRASLIERLSERDDALLAAYVSDEDGVSAARLRRGLARQARRAQVHPVLFGSAVTGAGVTELMAGLVQLLPTRAADPSAEASGRIFKIERGAGGEKLAYVRMFAGTVRARQRLRIHGPDGELIAGKPTAIRVSCRGGWDARTAVRGGEIAKLWGLPGVRIGDVIGVTRDLVTTLPPPTMQTVVAPVRARDDGALRAALARLAEQDPLINVRADDTGREVSVCLYGEVQKEVIEATLAADFGIAVTFRQTTTICVERPARSGEAVEILNGDDNPFQATIGLRIRPLPPGSGIAFLTAVAPATMPLHIYKNAENFTAAMGSYVRDALHEGRYGWQVTDCDITLFHCGYCVADGPPSRRGPDSTAADFRGLTPIVVARALEDAGTVVCEPNLRASLEVPVWSISGVTNALGRLGAVVRAQSVREDLATIEAGMPAARLHRLQVQLAALTAGDGVVESTFDGYRPVPGEPPVRPRADRPVPRSVGPHSHP
ncbi:MAG TPA: translation factor GTPase family protein [Micromonosporaceae bacterium]